MSIIGLALLLLSGFVKVPAQSGSDNLPEIRSEIYDSSAIGNGKIFLSNYRELGTNFQGDAKFHASVMILNNDGSPFFSKDIGPTKGTGLVDFKMHPNGMMSYPKVLKNYLWTGGGEVLHMVMDKSFNVVDSFQMGNGYVAETHDFRILPNGHALLMGYYLTPFDLSKKVEGGQPNAMIDGAVIQELDGNKNVVFQWRTWDYLSLDMIPWQMVRGNTQQIVNAFHLNALTMDHDGNLLLGTPAMGMKISRQSGEIMWIIGGVFNQFSFLNVDSVQALGDFGGHTFHRLENGNIMVYDNSPFPWQPGADVISAEVVEYSLDEESKIAELVWKYTPSTRIAGWHAGSAQRLLEGNTVIGWGGPPVDSSSIVFSEVTTEGTKVMDVFFEGDMVESYRAFRFPVDDGIPDTEVLRFELAPGNTYEFSLGDSLDTGISIKVNNYSGDGYNELTVKKYNYAPVYPEFPGKAPRVLPARIVCSGYNINSMEAQVRFDIDKWDIQDPENAIIYHREFEGNGLFVPLETDYNNVTRQVRGNTKRLGEFIIAYPDLKSIVFTPGLLLPDDSALVNQKMPVLLKWNPKGYVNEYTLQVATDFGFSDIIVNEEYLTEALYVIPAIEENSTYYWRVKAMNDAGESEWSETRSFITSEPYLQIVSPNGNEVITRGLEYVIEWKGNIIDDVKLELFLNDELVTVIDTIAFNNPDQMFYKWEFPTSLDSACGYYIKATSIGNYKVYDYSDITFAVNDSSCANSKISYIEIISPGKDDIWSTDSTYKITWNDNISEFVKIELMQGSNAILEITTTSSSGNYDWTIPGNIEPSDDYYIKISSTTNEYISSSGDLFEIENVLSINHFINRHHLKIAPNPTNAVLRVQYTLEKNRQVSLGIYTITGMEIKRFFSLFQNSGSYNSSINLSGLPKGMYILRLTRDQIIENKKIIIH